MFDMVTLGAVAIFAGIAIILEALDPIITRSVSVPTDQEK